MATWPTLTLLKLRLDVTSNDFDDDIEGKLNAAIAQTKQSVGTWVEGVDTPSDALAQSALELAIAYASTGELANPTKARRLLAGERRRFPIG